MLNVFLCLVSDFTFPSWLQLLLTCACAIRNFSIESAAISAVLDLIGLTQSFIAQLERKGGSNQTYQDGMDDLEDGNQVAGDNTVSVLILPLLTPNDLVYMNEKTNFYQVAYWLLPLAVFIWCDRVVYRVCALSL